MSQRHNRPGVGDTSAPGNSNLPTPIYRGPQALPTHNLAAGRSAPHPYHAPNAALLIDFDNVTMGIRSDLTGELKNLLASDVIKGKVSVQRAYADWRRYPQYIVPLAEASIDMIMAPAYGSSKKNATDIRLSIDALELVFTRPEIGTFILLSGDSDFSSLVIKLKEYGKYVIGVGIRESSSDLLVMNCDEYFSYTALAGLVRSSDEEFVKRDPWELVEEAVQTMKNNGDVMRADRLKQVMQQIDPSFDEKNLGMAKFSRFITEAAQRGLVAIKKMESGQYEVDVFDGSKAAPAKPEVVPPSPPPAPPLPPLRPAKYQPSARKEEPKEEPATFDRDKAFELLKKALGKSLANGKSMLASKLKASAGRVFGKNKNMLEERVFTAILKGAHDAGLIDLRRKGDDYQISSFEDTKPIADQVKTKAEEEKSAATAPTSSVAAPVAPRGMGHRGVAAGKNGRGGHGGGIPAELLSIGIVGAVPAPKVAETPAPSVKESKPAAKKAATKKTAVKKAPIAKKAKVKA